MAQRTFPEFHPTDNSGYNTNNSYNNESKQFLDAYKGNNPTTNYFPHNTTSLYDAFNKDNQIKKWLSPLKPQFRHQGVQENRVDGVGGWFLEKNEFREWSSSRGIPKQGVLFCYGHPGVGKTHIRLVRRLSRPSGYH